MRRRGDSTRLGAFRRLAGPVGAGCGDRGTDVLQRLDGHHARVDHRRAGVARRHRSGCWPAGATRGSILAPLAAAMVAARGARRFSAATGSALHDLRDDRRAEFLVHAKWQRWPRRCVGVGREVGPGDAHRAFAGCASHDQFQNFRHRGERVRAKLVASLASVSRPLAQRAPWR